MVGCQYMKNKKPLGRPTEKTPEAMSKIYEAAALGCTVEEMALASGVHRATLHNWMKEDEELRDRIDELKQTPYLKARRTIDKAIGENPQYAFEYMKRKKKDEFSERSEFTGKDGKDLPVPIISLGNVSTDNSD